MKNIHAILEQLLTLAPFPLTAADIREGLADLQLALAGLAVEVLEAERKELPLREAAELERFPRMRLVHLAIFDLLRFELPKEYREVLREVSADSQEEPLFVRDIKLALVNCARESDNPAERAVSRFFLFEIIRLGMVIVAWLAGGIEAVGGDQQDIDELAESEVDEWLSRPLLPGPIRTFDVIFAGALLRLNGRADVLAEMMNELSDEARRAQLFRAAVEAKLREMPAAEAVLIRNMVAPALDGQHVTVERLAGLHPMALGQHKTEALYKKQQRAFLKLRQGQDVKRSNPALFDMIREMTKEG